MKPPSMKSPSMKSTVLASIAALTMLIAPAAHAQAPASVPVQGYLVTDAGAPVSASTTFTLRLFDVESGGAALHEEVQTADVDRGFFGLYLGDGAALDLTLFRGPLWLSVEIDGAGEMSPRLALGTVPYAAYAEHAGSVVDGSIERAALAPSALPASGTTVVSGNVTTTGVAELDAFSVTVPGPGTLAIMITGTYIRGCDAGGASSLLCTGWLGICTTSASSGSCDRSYRRVDTVDADDASGTDARGLVTISRQFNVGGAGTTQYFVNASGGPTGEPLVFDGTVTAIYTPGPALTVTNP